MKPRVLHVNDVANVGKNLVAGLRSLGVEAELYQPTIGTHRSARTKRFLLPFTRTVEAFQLRWLVTRGNFDIVHVHYARFAFMPLLTGMPYYLHCHGGDIHVDLTRPGWREFTQLAIRRAERVFCSTPDLIEPLHTIRADCLFLPNPVDLARFAPRAGEKHRPLRLLSISKLDARKGVANILRAIELIWEARPETHVGLMGHGDVEEQANDFLKRYANSPNVHIHPPLAHEQMPDVIHSHDIVLGQQSPEIAAMGMSELEAMACAKPVICNFAYGWAYKDPPPVLQAQTPEGIRDQTLRLLDNHELRQTAGIESRRWVEEHHDVLRIAAKLLNFYAI